MMQDFKVIISGSRDFDDYNLLFRACEHYLKDKMKTHQIVIISGGARGADRLGERYARDRGFKCELMKADWNNLGKSAGFIRNADMAAVADACIAFWDGESRGTAHMIDCMTRVQQKPIRVVKYLEPNQFKTTIT